MEMDKLDMFDARWRSVYILLPHERNVLASSTPKESSPDAQGVQRREMVEPLRPTGVSFESSESQPQ